MATDEELVEAAHVLVHAVPAKFADGTEAVMALMAAAMIIIRGGGAEALTWYRDALLMALESVDDAIEGTEGPGVRLQVILAVAVSGVRSADGAPAVRLRVDVGGVESVDGAIDMDTAAWLADALRTLVDGGVPRAGEVG